MRNWWRLWLPLGNLIVDCVLLASWYGRVAPPSPTPAMHRLQEDAGIRFDISLHQAPPPEYLLIATGNLPALLLTESVLLSAGWPTDTIRVPYMLLHESLALLIWFGIAGALVNRELTIYKSVKTFLVIRSLGPPQAFLLPTFSLIWRMQSICWLLFAGYLVFAGVRRAVSAIGPAKIPEKNS